MRSLAVHPEVLFLDEPFSALDYEMTLFMRDKLQDIFQATRTTMILVSHDRDFVDRLATSTIALNGRGDVVETPGGWQDFLRQNPGFLQPGANPRPQDKDAAQRAAAADEARRVEKAEPSDRAPTRKSRRRMRKTSAP